MPAEEKKALKSHGSALVRVVKHARLEPSGDIGSRAPARNHNPGQTPAPGSQPRENKKALLFGGKRLVAQWSAC
jgi:hypothetical protein